MIGGIHVRLVPAGIVYPALQIVGNDHLGDPAEILQRPDMGAHPVRKACLRQVFKAERNGCAKGTGISTQGQSEENTTVDAADGPGFRCPRQTYHRACPRP